MSPANRQIPDFAERLLSWFDQHGRKDLPWQQDISPYRVWVSEIMLQQTQVKTVIPYFQRFMETFPTVADLAAATEDEVLHLWTGLGYYARARNLHKAAKKVVAEYNGEFPTTQHELESLSGIGRSTAGAIRAIAFKQQAAILDGNVKRVLARCFAVAGWPGENAVADELWGITEQLTPGHRTADYTQAIMDLGATLCTRSRPGCVMCPFQEDCKALKTGKVSDLPGKKPKKALPVKDTMMLVITNSTREVLLQRRPSSGLWGGLWSFPETDKAKLTDTLSNLLGEVPAFAKGETFRHSFTHYHLDITPVFVQLATELDSVMEPGQQEWVPVDGSQQIGLTRPVTRILETLRDQLL